MSAWHEDAGLAVLVAQEKALHPGMTVGEIAGAGHTQTHAETDHVPDPTDKADPEGVDAADFMVAGPFTHDDAVDLAHALQVGRDPRIAYVIWDRHIMSSTIAPWTWRTYSGTDPHTGHVHVSVNDSHHSNHSKWVLELKTHDFESLAGFSLPVLKAGDDDDNYQGYRAVSRAQELLNFLGAGLTVDGNYGDNSVAAVKRICGGDGRTINRAAWVKLAGLSQR